MVRGASALAFVLTFSALAASPSPARAQEDPPSVLRYGFDGFWTGAQVGLASGYLATGSEYESEEWRKLAFGTGLGALIGVGVGISLGVADLGSSPPATGHLVLRDMGYGVGLGAIVGTAVGALFLIDGGEPKTLLNGAAVGTLAGAGAGIVFGLIESAASHPEPASTATLRLTFIGSDQSYLPLPALVGTF
jgi:hypothetical protein